jgi:hypothetical protein
MVKTCDACGLPAPLDAGACAMCDRPFAADSPTGYRLSAAANGYRWTVDGQEVLTAAFRDGTWDVHDADTDRALVTLVPVDDDSTCRMALVDHVDRVVVTFSPAHWDQGAMGIVRDSFGDALLLIRTDGPTGLHVIDVAGNVLALASTLPGRTRPGLDILVTGAGARQRSHLVLALTLAVELLRLDDLRTVA